MTHDSKANFSSGGDGDRRIFIEEARERHKLEDRIIMLGAVPHANVRNVSKGVSEGGRGGGKEGPITAAPCAWVYRALLLWLYVK